MAPQERALSEHREDWTFGSRKPFTVRRLPSSVFLRDATSTRTYFRHMRNPNQNPLDSAAPTLFAEYSATSTVGVSVRRGDARLRLKEMATAEESVRHQEAVNGAITDRLARMRADHELDMQYLMRFGVKASERKAFREILEDVSCHGGLSLRDAANLAHAQSIGGVNED